MKSVFGHNGTPSQDREPSNATFCGCCGTPFDTKDTRWNGKGQYHSTSWCCECVDRCHDTEIADHRCPVCDPTALRKLEASV